MKKWSIFELEKYKDYLFRENKIIFHKYYYENDKGFIFTKSLCNILYLHLLPFVRITTEFYPTFSLKLTLYISGKNKTLVDKIKKLVLFYNRNQMMHFDLAISKLDNLKKDYKIEIDIMEEDEENVPNNTQDFFFYKFNLELTDTIQSYYKYIPNYKSYGIDYFECDGLIADAIEILNKKGWPTKYSCDSDDEAPFNPKINYVPENENYELKNIIHCSGYVNFIFECSISDYIKTIRKLKYYYKKGIKKYQFLDVLYFDINGLSKGYIDFLRKSNQMDKKIIFNLSIRAKTPNRLIFNRAIEEYSKILPKFK